MGKVRQRRAPTEKASRRGRGDASDGGQSTHDIDDTASSDPGVISLLFYFIKVVLLSVISLPFWFLTGILTLLYGRPPKMVFVSQAYRFLQYTIQSSEMSYFAKADLMMTIIVHTMTSRISGFCSLLDEVLYGKQLNSVSITQPLFVMSAYRSASTEMARTLAKDTNKFVAPNAIMCAFPYLWLWNLITWIVGDDSGISTDEANGYLNKNFSKESLERHDNNHFAIDTFDGYFLSSHLNGLAFRLGPDVIVKELNCAKFDDCNRYLFEHCFVEHVDRIAKKTLLYKGVDLDHTFMLKGHFLQSADALQRKYPDARFLSVLRDPLDRLKSGINHMAVNATLWQGRSPNWESLTEAFQRIEVQYCRLEMNWYGKPDNIGNTRRLAVQFDDFVRNSQKTIKRIYEDLLNSDQNETPHFDIPSKAATKYTVDRSLCELGVNEAELSRHFAEYKTWMKKQ